MHQTSVRVLIDRPNYIVIDKPPHLPFHGTSTQLGVMQTLRRLQSTDRIGYSGPLFPVHRLDTITSGCLIVAKTSEAAAAFSSLFQQKDNKIDKYYVAVSDKRPKKKQGSVIGDMKKSRGGSYMLTREVSNPAITRFASAGLPGRRPGLRAYVLKPVNSGKTHQLRVAMKSLGSPVLGDSRYHDQRSLLEDRGYLHCAALRFKVLGEFCQVVCLPMYGSEFLSDEFKNVFQTWFPIGMGEEDIWFADNPLLKSDVHYTC